MKWIIFLFLHFLPGQSLHALAVGDYEESQRKAVLEATKRWYRNLSQEKGTEKAVAEINARIRNAYKPKIPIWLRVVSTPGSSNGRHGNGHGKGNGGGGGNGHNDWMPYGSNDPAPFKYGDLVTSKSHPEYGVQFVMSVVRIELYGSRGEIQDTTWIVHTAWAQKDTGLIKLYQAEHTDFDLFKYPEGYDTTPPFQEGDKVVSKRHPEYGVQTVGGVVLTDHGYGKFWKVNTIYQIEPGSNVFFMYSAPATDFKKEQ